MSLEIALPRHIEQHLQTEWENEFSQRAAKALVIEGYRTGAFSLGEVAEMLNLSMLISQYIDRYALLCCLIWIKSSLDEQ